MTADRNEYNRQWRSKPENKEKHKEASRRWEAQNKDKRREYNKRARLAFRPAIIQHYGGCCRCCGQINIKFLELHHINNDGPAHAKYHKVSRLNLWRKLYSLDFPDDGFQVEVLCANCHRAITSYGECDCQN